MALASMNRPAKAHLTAQEVAEALNITPDELRGLIRRHIAESDSDLAHMREASFHPADLLVLKFLAGRANR